MRSNDPRQWQSGVGTVSASAPRPAKRSRSVPDQRLPHGGGSPAVPTRMGHISTHLSHTSGVGSEPDSLVAPDPEEAADRLLRDLRTSPQGLSTREAQRRLLQYGPNGLQRRANASGLLSLHASSPTRWRCCCGWRQGCADRWLTRGCRRGSADHRAQRRVLVRAGAAGRAGGRGAGQIPAAAGQGRARRRRHRDRCDRSWSRATSW